jgi:hypothetical protein
LGKSVHARKEKQISLFRDSIKVDGYVNSTCFISQYHYKTL